VVLGADHHHLVLFQSGGKARVEDFRIEINHSIQSNGGSFHKAADLGLDGQHLLDAFAQVGIFAAGFGKVSDTSLWGLDFQSREEDGF